MKKTITSKRPIILCSCMVALLFYVNLSFANETRHPKRGAAHQILMKHLLDLSSEQVEAIKTIRTSYKEQMVKERENIRRAREVFKRTAEANDDVAAARLAYAPVAAAMEDMAINRMLMRKEINNVLTAEQTEKAELLRSELFKSKPKHHPVVESDWE